MRQKSIPVKEGVFLSQSLRKLVTLNEYMPRELRSMENVFSTSYQVDKEETYTEKTMEERNNDSLNLPHDVYTSQRYPLTMNTCCLDPNSIITIFFIK
jgi:hypothetical protein